jgi:hypothetical protein
VYSLTIWRRRAAQPKKAKRAKAGRLDAMPCNGCGRAATRRCRLCRAAAYCGASCCAKDAPAHRRAHLFRGICTPAGSAAAAALSAFDSEVCYADRSYFAHAQMYEGE